MSTAENSDHENEQRRPTDDERRAEMQRVLDEMFGSMPDLEVPPRHEWDRQDRD